MLVCGGDAGGAHIVAVCDEAEDVVRGGDGLLLEADDLHLLLVVLQHPQLCLLVQQVKHL